MAECLLPKHGDGWSALSTPTGGRRYPLSPAHSTASTRVLPPIRRPFWTTLGAWPGRHLLGTAAHAGTGPASPPQDRASRRRGRRQAGKAAARPGKAAAMPASPPQDRACRRRARRKAGKPGATPGKAAVRPGHAGKPGQAAARPGKAARESASALLGWPSRDLGPP